MNEATSCGSFSSAACCDCWATSSSVARTTFRFRSTSFSKPANMADCAATSELTVAFWRARTCWGMALIGISCQGPAGPENFTTVCDDKTCADLVGKFTAGAFAALHNCHSTDLKSLVKHFLCVATIACRTPRGATCVPLFLQPGLIRLGDTRNDAVSIVFYTSDSLTALPSSTVRHNKKGQPGPNQPQPYQLHWRPHAPHFP
ncbi:Uncharacterised protein [Bordetella pertussis]|nr:Uncharacterised protein [Bordetella pertussis]CFU80779.1 Uncharacterised protein [Bordetella pertussis]CPK91880.1 Uncharacterised protein [Bordetella pertussis]CPL67232.1 Uncharacterised protein [Bordetella pertussis]CPM70559.1 Uncharacterised protein [Bordetella pertussis]